MTMQIGFTVALVKKLEFLLVETSTLVKLLEPGVTISSLAGYLLCQALDEAIGGGQGWSREITRGEVD